MQITSALILGAAAAVIAAPSFGNVNQSKPINASQAQAISIYRASLSQTPEVLNNPYVREWLNRAPAYVPGSLQLKRVRRSLAALPTTGTPNSAAITNAAPQRMLQQNGDYYPDMIVGGIQHWQPSHFPLRVFVAQGGGAGYKPTFPGYFADAMQQWNTISGGRISFTPVSSPEGADITVQWVPYGTPTECGSTVAHWVPDGRGHQIITRATVKLSTVEPSGYTTDAEMKKICLHELGHALGLKHSSNPADIMYWQSNMQQATALGPRDSATINKLYSVD